MVRAKETVVFISPEGEHIEVSVDDVPAMLNFITRGAFKMPWAQYLQQRKHIEFEHLDVKVA